MRKKYLAVTDRDYELAERLLPFHGIIRTDLRDLPVAILESALYVTESQLRKNTGTHYTPRKLAEEVVEHALEPLLYHVGPLQTADKTQWTHKTAAEILELKVADIAMGSAAFLVAAARYLGQALVSAWGREGTVVLSPQDDTAPRDADEDPIVVEARRQIIEHCLYGVDINPMAVEMAKLSLWLVSMDAKRPFTFLDDRLIAGDSLLGVTSVEQIEYLHLDPNKARELRKDMLPFMDDVQSIVAAAAEARRKINEIDLGKDPIAALEQKRALLNDAEMQTSRLERFADLTVGHALAGSRKNSPGMPAVKSKEALYEQAVTLAQHIAEGEEFAARQVAREWLATDQSVEAVGAGMARNPLHWPLKFPEVFERGGFNAVIGNPPFLGGTKLSPALGWAYREYLATAMSAGVRATNVDLIAFFFLRVARLTERSSGQLGLIATNTLAQGDTRKVGLEQILASGQLVIRRSIKSARWPARSASLEYCAVWMSGIALGDGVPALADGQPASRITASLEASNGTSGEPRGLVASQKKAFLGHHVNGAGFILDDDEAVNLFAADSHNRRVVLPYLGGDDIGTRPDSTASRWVVCFRDWDEEAASEYSLPYRLVLDRVKPERMTRNRESHRKYWWRFADYRRGLEVAIAGIDHCIVYIRHTKTVMPVRLTSRQIFSDATVVVADQDFGMLACLSSSVHVLWVINRGGNLGHTPRYTPSDVFETFPFQA
ncbi:Eco57I restriction-modification methylase domain-containing protein [Pseudonocardia benzenivorans]